MGSLALNVAAVPGDERLSDGDRRHDLAEFPRSWRWRALAFNQLLLAFDRSGGRGRSSRAASRGIAPAAEPLVAAAPRRLSPMSRSARPLTDDRAPVEWVTDRMILGYAARGGELEQDLLPTAP